MNLLKINAAKKVLFGVVILIIIIVLLSSICIVKSGNVGVVSIMGKIQDQSFQPGINLKIPMISSVIMVNTKTQKFEIVAQSASKDLQIVEGNVVVNFHILPSEAGNLYKNVGKEYLEIIISPVVQDTFKAVYAKYSAEELITKRQFASNDIKTMLAEKFKPYGIVVDGFNITNLDFSDEFNAAIEAKQTAQQNALKAKQDLERIKIEAEQAKVKAQGEAEAIRIIQNQLNIGGQNYINYITVTKWNGVLPQVQGDGAAIIDMRKSE